MARVHWSFDVPKPRCAPADTEDLRGVVRLMLFRPLSQLSTGMMSRSWQLEVALMTCCCDTLREQLLFLSALLLSCLLL